jgi:hypothetical protein
MACLLVDAILLVTGTSKQNVVKMSRVGLVPILTAAIALLVSMALLTSAAIP